MDKQHTIFEHYNHEKVSFYQLKFIF